MSQNVINEKPRCFVLMSGGLDSILAVKLM